MVFVFLFTKIGANGLSCNCSKGKDAQFVKNIIHIAGISVLCLLHTFSVANAQQEGELLSAGLPEYQAGGGGAQGGKLSSVGSDSMGGLMDLWVKAYEEFNPKVSIQIVSRGSATAPVALIEGSADLGPMARPMKVPELEKFRAKFGFKPTQVRVAMANVVVYVSVDNPLTEISFDELDAIYSATRNRGSKQSVEKWSQLGVSESAIADQKVLPIRSSQNDYLSNQFRQRVLLQGEFAESVTTVTNANTLFEAIRKNPATIGYGAFSTPVDGVKKLAIPKDDKSPGVFPTLKTIANGDYPFARFLNLYVVRHPGKELDSTIVDFLRFVLSKQGQKILLSQGLLPLTADIVAEELEKLN